ncbi:MAG: hypothetical protein V7746_11245 [Halioglobus sp.]
MFRVVMMLILATALQACDLISDPNTLSESDSAELISRVEQRWYALEDKDFGRAYEYTTPNYRRVFSKMLYINKFSYGVEWELTGVEVVNYDAPAAVASVAVRVMSKPAKQTSTASIAIGATPVTLREKWIKTEGEWWHIAKD